MRPHALLSALCLLTFTAAVLTAGALTAGEGGRDRTYPPKFDGAVEEVYRTVGDTQLKLWIFNPPNLNAAPTGTPAIVFFFGGGWVSGTPTQFEAQARHLAARGMVAIAADYRVASRHKAKPADCVSDAHAAVRYIRANAARLKIDPNRIASAGGSAGGHLAASTALVESEPAADENKAVSAIPNALVLFNPGLVLAPIDGYDPKGFGTNLTADKLGAPPEKLSPAHHVKAGTPPTIIFHGTADTTVPFSSAEFFTQRMKAAGNRCELLSFEGQPHSFFNKEPFKAQTLKAADDFLVSLGWLKPAAGKTEAPK